MTSFSAPSIALTLIDELVNQGVTDIVISPGSRSAPLALAVAGRPELRLHVRIDERTAAFLALGLARGSGWPTVLICSSGTATANYHPAVLEAHHAGVGLIVMTADRPPELRGIGANQTADQQGLYGRATRWAGEVPMPEAMAEVTSEVPSDDGAPEGSAPRDVEPDPATYGTTLRSQVAVAVAAAQGDPGVPGPVHLNVPLREPLLDPAAEVLPGRAALAPTLTMAQDPGSVSSPLPDAADILRPGRRGLVIAGEGAVEPAEALDVAQALGYPVLAEPTSGLRLRKPAVQAGHWLAAAPEFVAEHHPEVVILLGRPVLSRPISSLVDLADDVVVCDPLGRGWDPGRNATHVVARTLTDWANPVVRMREVDGIRPANSRMRRPGRAAAEGDAPDPGVAGESSWLTDWLDADRRAVEIIAALLADGPEPTELGTVAALARAMPAGSTLVCASSLPIRHLNQVLPVRDGLRVVGNRGLSGIDGFISTAIGVALAADGPTAALAGDLSVIHDLTGLVLGPGEPRPSLPIVVLNNNGGGIFDLLPYGNDVDADTFKRLFATPHDVPLEGVAITLGCGHTMLDDPAELGQVLQDAWATPGITLVEVTTDTSAETARYHRIRQAVADGLAG